MGEFIRCTWTTTVVSAVVDCSIGSTDTTLADGDDYLEIEGWAVGRRWAKAEGEGEGTQVRQIWGKLPFTNLENHNKRLNKFFAIKGITSRHPPLFVGSTVCTKSRFF